MIRWDRPALELPEGFTERGREYRLLGGLLKEEVGYGRNGHGSPCRWKAGQRSRACCN